MENLKMNELSLNSNNMDVKLDEVKDKSVELGPDGNGLSAIRTILICFKIKLL